MILPGSSNTRACPSAIEGHTLHVPTFADIEDERQRALVPSLSATAAAFSPSSQVE